MRVIVFPEYLQALERAQDFLFDAGAVTAAERLHDDALGKVSERLAQFPRVGRDFLARNVATAEALALVEAVRVASGGSIELREHVVGDYLVLYALRGDVLYLLTLRHHRQCGFDFREA